MTGAVHDPLYADYSAKRAPLTAEYHKRVNVLMINTIVDYFGQDNTQDKTA